MWWFLSPDTRVFLTVAVDLVICGIQEPVRFALEIRAKVYPSSERFWQFTKKPHYERFHVLLKPVSVLSFLFSLQALWCMLQIIIWVVRCSQTKGGSGWEKAECCCFRLCDLKMLDKKSFISLQWNLISTVCLCGA